LLQATKTSNTSTDVISFNLVDLIVNGFMNSRVENMNAKTNKKRGKH
jgi:hypothetical protein